MTNRALNEPAEIPAELDRWNWGAFLLNWIWGIGNSVFIALLMLVPLVNIVMIFILGARGSRWAWRNRAWRDAEHFRSVQRKWAIAGVVAWVVVIGGAGALVFWVPTTMRNSDAYRMTMQAVQADARVKDAVGDDVHGGFWLSGSLNIGAGGSGDAVFSIPLYGSRGSATALSKAIRADGKWQIRLLIVSVEGSSTPILLINEDKISVPGAALPI